MEKRKDRSTVVSLIVVVFAVVLVSGGVFAIDTFISNSVSYFNGSVGIGTASPFSALDIVGDLNFSGLIYGNGSQLTNLPEGILGISIGNSEIDANAVNTTQIIDGTIVDADVSDSTNLTLGQRLIFALGGFIQNIISGRVDVNGTLNVTDSLEVGGNASANYFIGNGSLLTDVVASGIADGAVTNSKIAANAINTTHILDGNITDAKIDSLNWTKLNTVPSGFSDDIDNNTLYFSDGIYIYNNGSDFFFLNETKLNFTIDGLILLNRTNGVYIYDVNRSILFNETKLNETINLIGNYSAGEGITIVGKEINAALGTSVGNTEIDANAVNTTQIIDGTITDVDISDSTNLTLGQKIIFALGGFIQNIISGQVDVNGTLNVTGGLNVDSGTLFVNETSDRVGIGTTSPTQVLDVNGSVNVSGVYYGNGSGLSDIGASSLLADSINTTHILDGTILTGDLASGSIANEKVVADSINTTQIIDGTIIADDLSSGSINTTHIVDSTIVDADISDTTNLTLGQRIVFALGGFIQNIISGRVDVNGTLNVTDNLIVGGDITSASEDSSNSSVINVLTLEHTTSESSNGTTGIGTGILFRTEDSFGNIEDSGQIQSFLTNATNGSEESALTFLTRTEGGSLTEQIRITGSGNVGIGTPTPTQALDVNGNVNITGVYYGNGSGLTDVGADSLNPDSFNTSHILDGTILAGDLAVSSVNTTHILDGTILTEDLANGSVNNFKVAVDSINTTQIIDGTIIDADISDTTNLTLGQRLIFALGGFIQNIVSGRVDINGTLNVTGGLNVDSGTLFVKEANDRVGIGTTSPTQALDVNGSVNITGVYYGNGSGLTDIGASSLLAGSINTTHILDGTILTGDLASGSIANEKVVANTINTTQIIDGTIITDDLAASSVNTTHIVDGTILTEDIADNNITSSKITNGTIIDADISDSTNLTLGQRIVFALGGFIQNIISGRVDVNGTLNVTGGLNVDSGTLFVNGTSDRVGIGTISPTQALDVNGSVNVSGVYYGNGSGLVGITGGSISSNSIDTAHILDGTIIADDLAASSVNTSHILDGNITDVKIDSLNWTKLNTIPSGFSDDIDNNTLYYADGIYIYNNGSDFFFLNETKLNETINLIGNYSAGNGITIVGKKINATLGASVGNAEIDANTVNTTQIIDGTILDADISDSINLTLGQRLIFALGGFIQNIISGRVDVNGTLNVTDSLIVGGEITSTVDDVSNSSVVNVLTLEHTTSESSNGTTGIGTGVLFRTEDSMGEIENVGQIQSFLTNATNGSEESALTLLTRTGGGSLTEKLRITGSGNIGIGIKIPTQKLDVNGSMNISGVYYGNGSGITDIGADSLSAGSVNTTHILDGTILADDLAVSSVNTTHILDGTIITEDIANNNITSSKISNGTIVDADISDTTNLTLGQRLIFALGGFIQNIISGQVDVNGTLNVTGGLNVDSGTLFVNGTSDRVGIGTASPIQKLDVNGSVNVSGIIYGNGSGLTGIGASSLLAGSINTTHILDSTILAEDISVDAINTTHILDGTILAGDLANGSVNNFKVDIDAVNTTQIIDGTIVDADISDTTNLTLGQRLVFALGGFIQNIISGRVDVDGALNVTGGLNVGGNADISGNLTVANNIDITKGSLFQPVYPSDDGLVVYIPFSEPDGSTQFDRSPYGNDGTQFGNTVCNVTFGKYGSACTFDGDNDYVRLASEPPTENGSFTLEAWINADNLTGANTNHGMGIMVSTLADTAGDWILSVDNDGAIQFHNWRESGDIPDGRSFTANGVITEDQWYHVVAVWDGTNNKIFVNGVDQGTLSTTNTAAGWTTRHEIGRSSPSSAYSFNGTIDEVKIYTRALASEEIRSQYLRGSGFGASGAIVADKFRVVNTTGTNVMEVNLIGLVLNEGSFVGNGSGLTDIGADSISADSINTTHILDGTIGNVDIDANAINTTQIIDGTIIADDLAVDSINTTHILVGTILADDLAVSSVNTTHILDGTVLTGDLANGSVNNFKVVVDSINTTQIIDGTILAEDIANNNITSSKITNGTIVDADISDSTNLTLGQKIVFALGGFIQNIVTGRVDVNGTLNVTDNMIVQNNLTVDTNSLFVDSGNNRVGIGTVSPLALLNPLGTAEQLRLSYDATEFTSFTVGSEGELNIEPTGGVGATFVPQITTTGQIRSTSALSGRDAGLYVRSINPQISLQETDASANEQIWSILSEAGLFKIGAYNEASNLREDAIVIDRTLSAIDSVSFPNGDVLITDNLTVGTNSLFVDSGNSKVGIGTTSPSSTLDVNGNVSLNSTLFVTELGDVGIGTSSPTTTLEVNGTTTITGDLNVTGTSYLGDITIDADNITVNNILSRDGNITFYNSSGSETMRITNDGNFGIGTTSPSAKLHISNGGNFLDPAGFADELVVEKDGASGISILSGNESTGSVVFGDTDESGRGSFGYDHTIEALILNVNGADRMVIDSLGRVGIGTLNPSHELNVIEDANITGSLIIDENTLFVNAATNRVGIGTSSPTQALDVNGSVNVSGSTYITENLTVDTDTLFVDSDNNRVGIGTTSPLAPLHVNSTSNETVLRLQDADGTCLQNPEAGSLVTSCSSDERLKKNVRNAQSVLEEFEDIKIKDYIVKASGKEHTGVIAQEINKTHPELVHEEGGELFVEQPNPWKLLKAIQELQEMFKSLVGGNYSVKSEVVFNEYVAGTAKISVNETEIEITFEKEYSVIPIITITPLEFIDGQYKVAEKTTKGFVIELQDIQSIEIAFDWHAFEKPAEKTISVADTVEVNVTNQTGFNETLQIKINGTITNETVANETVEVSNRTVELNTTIDENKSKKSVNQTEENNRSENATNNSTFVKNSTDFQVPSIEGSNDESVKESEVNLAVEEEIVSYEETSFLQLSLDLEPSLTNWEAIIADEEQQNSQNVFSRLFGMIWSGFGFNGW